MTSVCFIVPAHGRLGMSRACLGQLARTCAELEVSGVDATAVVIAEDENLEIAAGLGFIAVDRPNHPLGRKINDGYQHAAAAGVTHVVPFGTDDVIDPALLLGDLPTDKVTAHRLSAIVDETGTRLRRIKVSYEGGDGIRVIPTRMLQALRYRPLEDDRDRGMDGSMTTGLARAMRCVPRDLFVYNDLHDLQLVEFKSRGEQLNDYRSTSESFGYATESRSALVDLAGVYPDVFLDEVADVYQLAAA